MYTYIGIGFSQDIDPEKAAREAANQAKIKLNESKIDFALVLSTVHYNPHRTLPIINKILGSEKVIGSSTAAIILNDSVKTRGMAILTISSDSIKFGVGAVRNIHMTDLHLAGTSLARSCMADFGQHNRQAFLLFVDTHLENNSLLLKGIQETAGDVFPLIGAGSSDDFHFSDTFQFYQNNVLENSATGVIIGGHVNVGIATRHGWKPLGKPRLVDQSTGNILHTIDGQQASHIYQEYFGAQAAKAQSSPLGAMSILYPLGIRVEGNNEYLLRNAIDILKDGSIVCQGDVPASSEIHIMIGNKESCKMATHQAALEAKDSLIGKEAKLVIVLASMARLKLLGREAFQEIEKIQDVFGAQTPLIGMYTHGEISPFQSNERFKTTHVQNDSMVILAIS